MEVLTQLVETLGLNASFFYQLIIAVVVFFISKNTLWKPYIKNMEERERLTKGRLSNTKELDLKIESQKELYEKRVQQLDKDFQTVFSEMKEKALQEFSKNSLKMEEEHKESLKKKRAHLKAMVEDQQKLLQKEIPALQELLLTKIGNQ